MFLSNASHKMYLIILDPLMFNVIFKISLTRGFIVVDFALSLEVKPFLLINTTLDKHDKYMGDTNSNWHKFLPGTQKMITLLLLLANRPKL